DVGVARDEPHVTDLDAEPLRQELREARLVTLAGRERAEHHVETALRAHGDLRALARRAGVELEVVRQADAAIAPTPPRLGAARLEAGPIGERHRRVLRRGGAAAGVEGAGRGRRERVPRATRRRARGNRGWTARLARTCAPRAGPRAAPRTRPARTRHRPRGAYPRSPRPPVPQHAPRSPARRASPRRRR